MPDRQAQTIGGFFGLDIAQVPLVDDSVLSRWSRDAVSFLDFKNARSALYNLLECTHAKKLHLPGYSCPSLAAAAQAAQVEHSFYPLTDDLEPELSYLGEALSPGDHVLFVDFFGRSPCSDFLEFLNESIEITWIEDRAQALWPSEQTYADWVIYSPRKLFGVPDGGFLYSSKHSIEIYGSNRSVYDWDSLLERYTPRIGRYETVGTLQEVEWHDSYSSSEQSHDVNTGASARITKALLSRIPIQASILKRQENANTLLTELADWHAFEEPSQAPFCVVINVEDASQARSSLIQEAIFLPDFWPGLQMSDREFANVHRFRDSHLFLPCDHRYSKSDMERLSVIIKEQLGMA